MLNQAPPILTIGQLNELIRETLEDNFVHVGSVAKFQICLVQDPATGISPSKMNKVRSVVSCFAVPIARFRSTPNTVNR